MELGCWKRGDNLQVNLDSLRRDYHKHKVVPFIGSGLSVPFKVPTWGELIKSISEKYATGRLSFVMEAVNWHLDNRDYWGAIDQLKKYALIIDEDIQNDIVTMIKIRQIKLKDNGLHNYSDISRMNFKLHLTTNYENLLDDHLDCENKPILISDIKFNTQDLFDEKRVCHLHGYTSNSGTIVISEQSYKELYEDKKYESILSLVTGSMKILFMGFSFDDQFIQRLIKDHKEYFKGTHYILLENPSDEKIKKFREEFGLLTIPYDIKGSTHTEEIRKILNYISLPLEVSDSVANPIESHIIVGAGLSDMNQNVEENFFYRKLKLENVADGTIELASIFYIAAEKYIRQLKKNGMNIKVIDAIFYKVFVKYKERYEDTYKKFGDSHELVNVVHKSLAKIDFGRYGDLFNGNKSDDIENRGLIHLLAEDENKEVWWGEKRFE